MTDFAVSTANDTEPLAPRRAPAILSFAPLSLPPRAVEMLFVPHQQAAQIIIERVTAGASSGRRTPAEKPRHLVFHGPCGVGKSHLMALARSRITQLVEQTRPELRTRICLASLPEEQYGISTVGDLMSAILSVVRGWRADGRHNRPAGLAAEQVDAMSSMEHGLQAERAVREFVGNRLLVVLLENFDEMVVDMDDGEDAALANLLDRDRSLLLLATCRQWPPQGEPEPVLLSAEAAGSAGLTVSPEDSTSSIVLEETTDDAPREDPMLAAAAGRERSDPRPPSLWEQHFDEHVLTPMLDSESAGLLARVVALSGDKQLPVMIASPEGRARVAAARTLLGGNPRVVVALGRMMTADTTDELEPLFLEMMDKLASHRRERLWGCSPTDRHLVELLLNRRAPLGLSELAKAAQLTAPTATSHLVALARRGLVRESEGRRQESEYQAGDPLMRLHAGIGRAREEPIGLLVEFLRTLFSRGELAREVGAIHARGGLAVAEFRYRHYTAALVDADEQAQVSEHEHLYRAYRQAFDRRDYEAALKAAEELVTQRGQSADWGRKGRCLSKLRKPAEALACFEKAVERAPDRAVEWYNRGGKLAELGRIDDAVDSYDRALALERDNAAAWYNRGVALEQLHRWNEALRSYEEALRLAPGDPLAWNNKGVVLARLKRFGDAIKPFDMALKAAPRLARVWNNRALALAAVGRLETSLTSFDQVLALSPELPQAWADRGEVLRRLGRGRHALESLEHAVRLSPQEPAYKHLRARLQVELALTARKAGDTAEAHRQFLGALDGLDNSPRPAPETAVVERLLDGLQRFVSAGQRSAIGDELAIEERARLEPLLSAWDQAQQTPTLVFAPPPPPKNGAPADKHSTHSAEPAEIGFEEVPESSDAVEAVNPVRHATVPVGSDAGFEEFPPDPGIAEAGTAPQASRVATAARSNSSRGELSSAEEGSSVEILSAAGVIPSMTAATGDTDTGVKADRSASVDTPPIGSQPDSDFPVSRKGEFEELPADAPVTTPHAAVVAGTFSAEKDPPTDADVEKVSEGSCTGSTVELARFKEITAPTTEDGDAGGSTMLEIPALSDEALQSAINAAASEMLTAGAETPGAQTPGAQTPGAQTPGAQTPGAQTPGAQTPGAQTPGAQTTPIDINIIESGLANLRQVDSLPVTEEEISPIAHPAQVGDVSTAVASSHAGSPGMHIGTVDTIPVSGEFRLTDILAEDEGHAASRNFKATASVNPIPSASGPTHANRRSDGEGPVRPTRLPLPEPITRNPPSAITTRLVARLNAATSASTSSGSDADTASHATDTVPQAPNTVPQAPNTVPQAPNTVPQAPNTVPQAPNTVPQAPNTVPQAPNTASLPPTVTTGVSEVYICPLSEEEIPNLPDLLIADEESPRPPRPSQS